jgi:sigma-B regulation protein RsbU (phosphoserine phosphatase)
MKILIAEDDPIFRQLLQRKLEVWGHRVRAASNGQEAWEILQTEKSRFLLADWMMPLLDGLELCRKVRAADGGYVYIILLTAKDLTEHMVTGLDAGADDYMKKPCHWEELRARIRAGERILGLLDRVGTLSGLVPICASCKKVRDDRGYWGEIAAYVRRHTEADFSNSLCPECAKKDYSDYYDRILGGERD